MRHKAEKEKTKRVMFNVSEIKDWIGGVYYLHNIINLMLHSERLKRTFEIHVIATPSSSHVFKKYGSNIKLIEINIKDWHLNSMYLVWYANHYKIDYCFGLSLNCIERLIIKKAVIWIADFQYLHYPQYYSAPELKAKDDTIRYLAKQKNVLLLSSEDAKQDFIGHYKEYNCDCKVVHFASNIEDEVLDITEAEEAEVLHKYTLNQKRYIYIPNQFWQHKNHMVVLEMIEQYIMQEKEDMLFVFTGQMSDYRNKEYTNSLKCYFARDDIAKVAKNLGFLERKEQLIVMKNAVFLIQPSLFEGWGTVLEDAKVLDKRVILSDLPVHVEQKYEKCYLFRRTDAEDLLRWVRLLLKESVKDNLTVGLERFHKDSRKYAEELEKVLK